MISKLDYKLLGIFFTHIIICNLTIYSKDNEINTNDKVIGIDELYNDYLLKKDECYEVTKDQNYVLFDDFITRLYRLFADVKQDFYKYSENILKEKDRCAIKNLLLDKSSRMGKKGTYENSYKDNKNTIQQDKSISYYKSNDSNYSQSKFNNNNNIFNRVDIYGDLITLKDECIFPYTIYDFSRYREKIYDFEFIENYIHDAAKAKRNEEQKKLKKQQKNIIQNLTDKRPTIEEFCKYYERILKDFDEYIKNRSIYEYNYLERLRNFYYDILYENKFLSNIKSFIKTNKILIEGYNDNKNFINDTKDIFLINYLAEELKLKELENTLYSDTRSSISSLELPSNEAEKIEEKIKEYFHDHKNINIFNKSIDKLIQEVFDYENRKFLCYASKNINFSDKEFDNIKKINENNKN